MVENVQIPSLAVLLASSTYIHGVSSTDIATGGSTSTEFSQLAPGPNYQTAVSPHQLLDQYSDNFLTSAE
jgi:hypothetical protein